MKISTFCGLAASFALAAAALTGCKTGSACGTCTDKGACTDSSACAGEKAACCSTGEKAASACCAAGGEKTASAAKIVNAECPLSGGPAKNTITAAYNGKTVGFCCAGCAGKWEAATDAERAAMFSKVATN